MTAPADSASTRGTEVDMEEIRQTQFSTIALAIVTLSTIACIQMLPGTGFRGNRLVVFLSLLVEGSIAYILRTRAVRIARGVLLLGPTLSFALALQAFKSPIVPCFAILTVMANASVEPRWGFAAALLNTIPLCVLLPFDEVLLAALALLWLTAWFAWLSSRGLYTALQWAWNSQQRANALLERLRDRQAKLNQTLAALTEATRRLQRTSTELDLARRRADEARQMKEQFAVNISHELRTPLNLILGFSEMMYLTPDVYGDMVWPVTLRRDVRQIYQSSRQLLDLINDVLDLSRISAAQMPIHREQSDLAAIIDEAVNTSRNLLRGREIQVCTLLPATIPLLSLDRTRIRQVLLNLLNNAARFTEQGTIEVAARVDDREVVVSVADTGVGMRPEDVDTIFGEFSQVDMSLRRRREGAGLGLAISKRFVELHGGRIWAESELGRGSTFYFSLPRTSQAAIGQLLPGKVARRSQSNDQPTALVIDRDPSVGSILGRYLKRFRVLQAEDLVQAKDAITEHHPHVLIINVPPGTPSVPTLQQQALQILPPKVPVLFCSLPSQSWLALETRAQGCLTKPLKREALLDALARIPLARDVLIVDDDRGFVQLVARMLESTHKGYRVRCAYDGAEGLSMMREKLPDVLLLDLVMPEMDGFQLLAALDADETLSAVPVLVTTASDYGQDALARRSSSLTLARGKGLGTNEVIAYLQALLDATEAEYPPNILAELPATRPA